MHYIQISNHTIYHDESRLTRCEESANILSVSIASALSGQWKTKNPANTKLLSTDSLDSLLIYAHHQRSDSIINRLGTQRRTLSTLIVSISFAPKAKTRLPLLVYHLYVSSYHSGHSFNMPLIVSGAPFTAARVPPPGREDIVDMRLRAEENWKRRRMVSWVR